MSDNIALKVNNLSKCYQIYDKPQDRIKQAVFRGKKQYFREFWALQDINFDVKKGEAVGIIGRNGSGKSTLLQLICKTLFPTTGKVETMGRIAALLELGAGFNPEFTGRENVYINGAILGFSSKEIDARFDEIAAFAEIGQFMNQPVKSYSSGMFVRLAFAIQVCVNPDILIIDEALAVGDIFFRQKCYQLLNRLLEKGVAIILVTHSMNEVEQFCQRALLLKQGKAIFFGPANEAVKRYYLFDQELRENQVASQIIPPKLEINLIEDAKENFFWPSDTAFLDISHVPQVTNGWATCTGIALCDDEGNPCHAFQQGETATFYYEFKFLQDAEVPLVGTVLQNDKGVIVHGKGTTEYGTPVPSFVKKGDTLRCKQSISLELGIGEYSFEVGLGIMNQSDYSQRMHFRYDELDLTITRVCILSNISCFSVLPRRKASPVQLLHHGIANLPGDCKMVKIPLDLKRMHTETLASYDKSFE